MKLTWAKEIACGKVLAIVLLIVAGIMGEISPWTCAAIVIYLMDFTVTRK